MYRVAFSVDDSEDRQQFGAALQRCTIGDARIVAAFAGATTVDVFVDITDTAVPREVAAQLAQRLGIKEYEIARVEALPIPTLGTEAPMHRAHLRPATITQVRVHPDDRTLSVQVRHRPHETVETIDVEESGDAVRIAVFVAALDDDESNQYISLAVAFSWIEAVLEREIGARRILRQDPDHGFVRSQSVDDAPPPVAVPAWMRQEVAIEPVSAARELSPEEVLARLEHLAASARSREQRTREPRPRLPRVTFSTSH
jgi:ribosome-binding factor A